MKRALILLARGWQLGPSRVLPPTCRYQPSCSQYFILAVQKYGPLLGAWRGTLRICRCHPWSQGGYDPP